MPTVNIFEGHTMQDPFDGLDANAFQSESDYIEAAIARQLQFDDPAYQKARAKVVRLWQEKQRAAAEEAERAAYEEAVKAYKLSDYDKRKIKEAARSKVLSELNSGRISQSDMDRVEAKYIAEMTERAKRDAVSNERMNARIRAQMHKSRI